MTGAWAAAWVLIPTASLAALVVTGGQALSARRDASTAGAQLSIAAEQASELAALKANKPEIPELPGSTPGLAGRITSVLSACGLPSAAMTGVSPEADSVVELPGSPERYVRRRVTLTLAEVTLPALGSFLKGWHSAEPYWVPVSLEITPTQPRERFPGGDLPLNITIVFQGLFAARGGGP